MPRGFSGVKQASAELEARRQSGPGAGALWFRLPSDGDSAIVRFLEEGDDIFWSNCVEVPVEGRTWPADVPIGEREENPELYELAEQYDLKIKFKGWINVIWDDAPVFKRDGEGKIIKDSQNDPVVIDHKPQVAVWSSGIRLFEELDEIDTNYKGLCSRRFKVKRKGTGLNTKYSIVPEDIDSGPQKMTADEKKLAENKYDLNEFVKPPTPDEFLRKLTGQPSASSNGGESAPAQAVERNPFMRKRNS